MIKYSIHLPPDSQVQTHPTVANTEVIEIRNCEFAFRCTKTWDEMYKSAIDTMRFCKDCKKYVHLCTDDESIAKAIRENLCVAILVEGKEEPTFLLGALKARDWVPDEQ
jgi:hypothetical protein